MDVQQQIAEMQKQAKESGVHEAVAKIFQFQKKSMNLKGFSGGIIAETQAEVINWDGCEIQFDSAQHTMMSALQSSPFSGLLGQQTAKHLSLASLKESSSLSKDDSIKITMQDGTVIYELEKGKVKAFRKGKWVERLKAYADKLEAEHQQTQKAAAEQARQAQLKPFSDIDF